MRGAVSFFARINFFNKQFRFQPTWSTVGAQFEGSIFKPNYAANLYHHKIDRGLQPKTKQRLIMKLRFDGIRGIVLTISNCYFQTPRQLVVVLGNRSKLKKIYILFPLRVPLEQL